MNKPNIRLNEALLQNLINHCVEGIAVISAEGKPLYTSPSVEKILGYSIDDIMQLDVFSLLHADDVAPVSEVIARAVACPGVSLKGHPSRMLHKDGTWRWVDATITNMLDDPDIGGIIDVFYDVTEAKIAEEKLRHANRLYAFISQINQTIVHVKSEQELFDESCRVATEFGKFKTAWISLTDTLKQEINLVAQSGIAQADLSMFSGYKYSTDGPQDMVVRSGEYYVCNDVRNEPKFEAWKPYISKEGIKSCMIIPLKRSGKVLGTFNIHASEVDFFDKQEIALLVEAAGDISYALDFFGQEQSRQIAEDKLKHSEARLNEAQAIAKIGSWVSDLTTHQIIWSEEIYRIFEVEPGRFDGMYSSVLKYLHPDDREEVERKWKDWQHKNNTVKLEHRIVTAKGKEKYVVENWQMHYDEDGKAVQAIGTCQDITEKKEEELHKEKITNELIQRNKDLEQFSYMVSHNLRSPVANILGLTELLQQEKQGSKEQKSMLEYLDGTVKKLDSVIKDLNYVLQVKNQLDEHNETIVFSELLSDIKQSLLNKDSHEDVAIVSNFEAIDEMNSLKSYVYSIFHNLISNGIKYRREDVSSTVHITSFIEEGKLVLEFKDNGVGIDLERTGDEIFGLYKRFHNHIEGKGLGLFMVKTQVEVLGGTISIDSTVNVGTTFRIVFNMPE